MDVLAFSPPQGTTRVAHPGTFNANPLSAVAGTVMLEEIADGQALDTAEAQADQLRSGLNALLEEAGISGWAYGDRSIVHLLLGDAGVRAREAAASGVALNPRELLALDPMLASALRTACLFHGLDLMGPTMMVSSVHDQSVIAESLTRFRAVFATLSELGVLAASRDAA
jgi:glutamate-1-semialdehyde 2,1-aminomutase